VDEPGGNGTNWEWGDEPPDPSGARGPGEPPRRPPVPDFTALFELLDALRRLIPPELQQQFNALQRELLMPLRALIDWYLERLDARNQPVQIEEIPID
jgi:hypothetical protein